MMYNFEDYYEPSEYDQLIDETVDKIKKGILAKAKVDIEAQTKQAEYLNEKIAHLNKMICEDAKVIDSLRTTINLLKADIESKKSQPVYTKFKPGDTVYYLKEEYWETEYVNCPTCKGEGKISIHTGDFGDVEIVCPDCKNNASKSERARIGSKYLCKVPYRISKMYRGKISYALVEIDNSQTSISYHIENDESGEQPEDGLYYESELSLVKELLKKRNDDALHLAHEIMGDA